MGEFIWVDFGSDKDYIYWVLFLVYFLKLFLFLIFFLLKEIYYINFCSSFFFFSLFYLFDFIR